MELRVDGDDEATISGYAAVFNKKSLPLGFMGFREIVAPGAFAETIKTADVRALFNHDPSMVLGRTRNNTLTLEEDNKGLRVAIIGAFTKFIIRAYAGERLGLSETAARISSAINREYGADLFVTAFIGVLDEKSGAFRYINAGHPGPLHVSTERAVDILQATSTPLGIFPEQEFAEYGIVLEPGDFLVLYTDGLYEFRSGSEATPETIAREVGGLLPTDADTLVGKLLASAEGLSGGTFDDDVAILAMRRNPTRDETA